MSKQFTKQFKQRLYDFTLRLIKSLEGLDKDFISRRLGDQLLRSGTSILANYVEGQSASSKKDLINFLIIALKSSNESKLWLSLLKDTQRIDKALANDFQNELMEFSKIFAKSILTLKKQVNDGKNLKSKI